MRLHGISGQEAANAWLPQYIRDFNRRFTVVPARADDAHVPYTGTHEALRRILSVHTPRRLSSNLSCQFEGLLYQIKSADRGLSLRGADVTLVTHQQSETEVLWQGRVLPHTCSSKAIKQHAAVDGKAVNDKVEQALARRMPPQPIGHPWKKRMATQPGNLPPHAEFAHTKDYLAPATA